MHTHSELNIQPQGYEVMCHCQGLKNICTFHFTSNMIFKTCIQAKQYIQKPQENEKILKLKSFLDIINKTICEYFREEKVFNILCILHFQKEV